MTHFVPPPVVGILLLACSSPAWASQSPPDTTKYQAVNDSFALILAEYLDPRLASARDSGPSLHGCETRWACGCFGPGKVPPYHFRTRPLNSGATSYTSSTLGRAPSLTATRCFNDSVTTTWPAKRPTPLYD